MKDISEASTDFALSLLRKLSDESSGENVLFSPASISVALTMAYAGAANNTKKEMENVLFGGLADEAVQEAFGELVKTLNRQSDSYALHAANRLYAQQDFDFKREFLELCEKVYQSSLRAVDFKKSARGVAGEINGWVAAATKDRIRGLIPDGLLSHMTRLVLVNAIYFKGTWASRFNEDFTRKEAFHLAPGKDLVVDTMHKKARFGYAEDAKVQVLRMAYKGGGRLAMFIFLPKERFGLRDWLHNVNGTGLRKLMESCCSENEIIIFEVIVSLPKWKMEASFDLREQLNGLGMRDAFDEAEADFGRMAGCTEDPICISNVLHKAFIEVDEEGAEAAAATAVVFHFTMPASCPPPPQLKVFTADQPVAFAVAEGLNLLFLGTLNNF